MTVHDCHILHIDDNPRDIELMQIAFDDADGRRVSYAGITDPVAGVRQLIAEGDAPGSRPSLVMLDLNMPVLNGAQILERLRQEASFSDIPVIVFTTSKSDADRDRCLALGATAVIPKPNSFTDLLVVAKSILAYC